MFPEKFILYSGCLIGTRYQQAESSARFLLRKAGLEPREAVGFSCCPDPVVFKSAEPLDWLLMAARNLALAGKAGCVVVSLCSGCNETFAEARRVLMEDGDARRLVEERLKPVGLEISTPPETVHFARVLSGEGMLETLRRELKRPLAGLRVALFYGCHLLRPAELMGPDAVRFPRFLEPVVEVCGAEVVRWEGAGRCCGRGSLVPEVQKSVASALASEARAADADVVAVACPFCFSAFESVRDGPPVVFLQQLAAAALGATAEELGLGLHRRRVDALLTLEGERVG